MDIDILLGHNFTKKEMEQLDIGASSDLNGWYVYNHSKAIINIISGDFKKRKLFNSFNKFFTQIAAHETIHHINWCITGNDVANATEEKFVELMTGERKW